MNDLRRLPFMRCLERKGLAESFLDSDGSVQWYVTERADFLMEQGEPFDDDEEWVDTLH